MTPALVLPLIVAGLTAPALAEEKPPASASASARVGSAADPAPPPAPRVRGRVLGLHARPSYRPGDASRPTVCLIHGINSTSGSFVHLVPLLERDGYGVVLYDYPFQEELDRTAPAFVSALRDFRDRNGDRLPWALLTHSMGGLLARSYVEGPDYAGDVAALILIGPPNAGSALAPAQDLLEAIERLRATVDPDGRRLVVLGAKVGAAAADLAPGSRFLETLARSRPRDGVPYYVLAGDAGFLTREQRAQIEARYHHLRRRAGLLGGFASLALGNLPDVLDVLTEGTGDGAVAVASTRLDGVAEHVVIPANHVELIRGPLFYPDPGPVACEPFVRRWLAEALPVPADPGRAPIGDAAP